MGKVGEGDDAFATHPQHFINHFVGAAHRLQGLGHQDNIEHAIVEIIQALGIQVLFDHPYPPAHAGGDVVRVDLQAKSGGIALPLQEVQQGAIAATQIQDVVAGAYPLLNNFKICSHAPTSRATRSIYAVKMSVYLGVGIKKASWPQGASISA